MGSLRFASQTASLASQASQLPQILWCSKQLRLARDNVGAGLLAMGSLRFASQTASQASQASQLPHLCLMHDLR